MTRSSRRQFLGQAAAAGIAATFTIAGTKSSGNVLGRQRLVRMGVAGIRGRGGDHISEFLKIPGVQVTHLIDPDSRLFAGRTELVKSKGRNTPKCFQDIRQVLDDKELDAVSVATCNHWHSLITIWACQAGKDVYVEKPCSHNVFEGRQCVAAARKYQRIVQHGTQQRGGAAWQTARDIAAGKHGRLLVVRGRSYRVRNSIGVKAAQGLRRRSWTTTCGSARPRCSPTTRTWCTTTGTGSGTPATATSATTACMRWTPPAG